jgi:hypothetical protein
MPEMKYNAVYLLMLVLFVACDEVFEDSLDGKSVDILAPSDQVHINNNSIHFHWQELDEASHYRIQVAQPNFSLIEELLYDSATSSANIELALNPGVYQWRVRPENNSTYGDYVAHTLFVDSTLILSNQTLILQSPVNNFATSSEQIIFHWYPMENASQYSWRLYIGNWENELVLPEVLTSALATTVNDLPEGTYTWGVRGEAELNNSPYTTRTFVIDRTPPVAPNLSSPANGTLVNSPVTLRWSTTTDQDVVRDSVYIYSNSALTNSIWNGYSTNDSLSIELNTGVYYWRVRGLDAANNIGAWSASLSFQVQ